MIVDILIITFVGIARIILYPILAASDASLPSGFLTAISDFSGYLSVFGHFFDLTSFALAISLFLAFEGVILLIKLVTYIIRKVPGIS